MKPFRLNFCSSCALVGIAAGIAAVSLLVILSNYFLAFLTGFLHGAGEVFLACCQAFATFPAWATILGSCLFLIGGFLVVRRWREARHWRHLDVIREEYDPLVRLLRKRGFETYFEQIEAIREQIFRERDKIEELSVLLEDELPKIDSRITDLSNQLGRPGDDCEKEELRALLRELIENGSRLRGRRAELECFEKSKVRLASRLNCLRLKLLQEPEPGSPVDEIMRAIHSISLTEDAVERIRDDELKSPPSGAAEDPQNPPAFRRDPDSLRE